MSNNNITTNRKSELCKKLVHGNDGNKSVLKKSKMQDTSR